MFNKNLHIIGITTALVSLVLYSACATKEDNNDQSTSTTKVNKELTEKVDGILDIKGAIASTRITIPNFETSEHSCYNIQNMNSFSYLDNDKKEHIYRLMENHDVSALKGNLSNLDYSSSETQSCSTQCNDESINIVYESHLAKNIMLNKALGKKIGEIFSKILVSNELSIFEKPINTWANSNDKTIVLPVTQKFQIASDLISSGYKNKNEALKYAINEENNPALMLDLLLFNSKATNHVGIQSTFYTERDYFFNGIARRLRGWRGGRPTRNVRSQYGIARFDIPSLEIPNIKNRYAWLHPGRDVCVIDPQSGQYVRSVIQHRIPNICGISGTTNLVLWSVLVSKQDLSENELRLLILSVWSSLCSDGGHSLQEVLTAAKLISIYVKGLAEVDPYFKNNTSSVTLNNLESVTKEILPLGPQNSVAQDQESLKNIQNKIYNKTFDLITIEKREISAAEQQDRNDLEKYFSSHDQSKTAGFGTYYDSFFSKINDEDFAAERIASQLELEHYVQDNCSNK
jgi:hypothetical protein